MQARELRDIPEARRPTRLVTAPPGMPISDALRLLKRHSIHHLIVMSRGKCIGVVSTKELVPMALHSNWIGSARSVTVGELMCHCGEPLDENTDVQTTLSEMLERGVTALPLSREGQLIDIVTESDLLRVLNLLLRRASLSQVGNRRDAAIPSQLSTTISSALASAEV